MDWHLRFGGCRQNVGPHIQALSTHLVQKSRNKGLNLGLLFMQGGIKIENPYKPLIYPVTLINSRDVNVMRPTQRQHKGEPFPGELK